MAAATLNGVTVTSCTVQIPAWGIWWATVELDQPAALSGSVTLVLADLTLKGTVMSGGPWQGRARYRIAGGAGKWGKVIPAKAYANDLGVKLKTAIGDAAAACGESMGPIPNETTGGDFVRAEGPASRVLEELSPRAWYVDEAGVTQIGRRPRVTYSGGATRLTPPDLSRGTVDLAPTIIADLLPGVVVDGIEAVDVEHTLDKTLRTTIYGKGIADTSRLPEAFRRIITTFVAPHKYFATWEYRVVQRVGEYLDLQAVRVASGMPDLRHVRMRAGVAGCKGYPKLGSLVDVSFINGDPARPRVTSFDDSDAPGFPASELFLQSDDDIVLQGGATGAEATEHATSAQSLVLFVQTVLEQLATPLGGTVAVDAAVLAAIPLAAAATLSTPIKTALLAAIAAKTADSSGAQPGLGWPNVRGG